MTSEIAGPVWTPRLLSVIRIIMGLIYLQFGLSKYFGFPAASPAGFHMVSLIGLAGAIEVIGSLLLLIGLFTRPVAFIMSGEMAVAYCLRRVSVGFFPILNGGNLEATFACTFFLFFLFGGGSWSLDAIRAQFRG